MVVEIGLNCKGIEFLMPKSEFVGCSGASNVFKILAVREGMFLQS